MDTWGSPLADDETQALEALGRDELALFTRLHTRCLLEMDGPKRLTPIINQIAGMSFDQLDSLIDLYHQHYFPPTLPDGGDPPISVPDGPGADDAPPVVSSSPAAAPSQTTPGRDSPTPVANGQSNPKEPIYCPVCKIYLNGQTQYEDHCAGKKHNKKEATADIDAPDYWDKWKPSAPASDHGWVPTLDTTASASGRRWVPK